jgi:hypothetical protein
MWLKALFLIEKQVYLHSNQMLREVLGVEIFLYQQTLI